MNRVEILLTLLVLCVCQHATQALFRSTQQCRNTGFENVVACSSIPENAKLHFPSKHGFHIFKWQNMKFRQLDLGTYLYFRNQALSLITRARHTYLLLANESLSLGSQVLEISTNSRFKFHIAIDQGPRKPRTAEQARSKNIKGFERNLMCYTSATPQQIATAIADFSESGGYKLFKNNCRHFVLHVVSKLCGMNRVRVAKFLMFNIHMLVGEIYPERLAVKSRRFNNTATQLPVVFVPVESTRENDKRYALSNAQEIHNVLDEGDHDYNHHSHRLNTLHSDHNSRLL